jgi:hypothetical protein
MFRLSVLGLLSFALTFPAGAQTVIRWSPGLKDAPVAAAPAFWLAQNGAPKATIVIAADALDTNREAAQLLQEYVKKISGATLPIADDAAPVNGPAVLIGRSKLVDAFKLDIPAGYTRDLKEEGYLIRQIGDKLVLAGNDHRPNPAYKGSLFATIEVLQRLGCRWYFPGEFGEVHPHSRDISLPRLDETVRPSMAVRGFWWGMAPERRKDENLQALMTRWQTLNRYLPYGSVLPSAGDGSIMKPFQKWQTRVVDGKKVRVNVMFEEHPEYFAVNADGSHNPGYLCLSQPAVLDITTQAAFDYFEKNPDSIAFGISPPDGAPTCEEPMCRAKNKYFMQNEPSDPHIQDISGSFYWFMNELARRVEQKFPDKLVTTLAYSGRIRPPENFTFNDNVTVRTALLAHSRHHRYDSPTWQTQERVQLYKSWAKLVDNLVEREYYPVFQFNCNVPQQMYRASAFNIRTIKEIGMRGAEWEGRASFFTEGASDYIRGQLLWNTDTDVDALMDDYYARFYGPAGPVVRRFDEAVEKALTESLVDHHEEERIHEIYPHDFVVSVTDGVGDVEKLVANSDAATRQRVDYFRKVVSHFRDYSDMRYAESQLDFKLAAQKAQAMIDIENAVDAINHTFIDSDLEAYDAKKVYGEMGANASAHGKLKQYLAKAKLLDGSEGELVAALPETWKFKTDPHNQGVTFEWHRQPLDGSWRDMKTTSSWEIQGLQDEQAHGYDGYAWYRTSFEVPQKFAGKKMTLFLGGFNDQAWVWVNGKLAAATPYHPYWMRWKYHDQLDIGDFLEPGKTNTIAIRIWNDQDAGGLFRRSFIYAPVAAAQATQP